MRSFTILEILPEYHGMKDVIKKTFKDGNVDIRDRHRVTPRFTPPNADERTSNSRKIAICLQIFFFYVTFAMSN